MSLEEAILDKVRRLPPAKQEEVLRFADGLQDTASARIVPSRDRTVEMKWIELGIPLTHQTPTCCAVCFAGLERPIKIS